MDFYYDDFKFPKHYTIMHTKIGVALKPNFMNSLLYSALIFKYAFSVVTLRILNLHNKSPKIFAFDIFGLKRCTHPYMPC